MINLAFLLDITSSMSLQLESLKQVVSSLVDSVFQDANNELQVTIITFTESRTACYASHHCFVDGQRAVEFVRSIQLNNPPGTTIFDANGGDSDENHKAALMELLVLDASIPTIAFMITDAAPHMQRGGKSDEALNEMKYLRSMGYDKTDMFHLLELIKNHYQDNLILNVLKYGKFDMDVFGAMAATFQGLLMQPEETSTEMLTSGLMALLNEMFSRFSRSATVEKVDVWELPQLLAGFTIYDTCQLAAYTCEQDLGPSRARPVKEGSTKELLFGLVNRATVIVGDKFNKRAAEASALPEQIELVLVLAKYLSKSISRQDAWRRCLDLMEEIRAALPQEYASHFRVTQPFVTKWLDTNEDLAFNAEESTSVLHSAISLMTTDEQVVYLSQGDDRIRKRLLAVARLLLCHGAVIEFPKRIDHFEFSDKWAAQAMQATPQIAHIDFMDSWSAVVSAISPDVMNAADFLALIDGKTTARGLSNRKAAFNHAQLFADPHDRVGTALFQVASATQVLNVLAATLSGAPAGKFTPNMFRGTTASGLVMLLSTGASLPVYMWKIVNQLTHSLRISVGARPTQFECEPESPVSKLLFRLLRLHDTLSLDEHRAAIRLFLEEFLAATIQKALKFKTRKVMELVEQVVAYRHIDAVVDVLEAHPLEAEHWTFSVDAACEVAAGSKLLKTFRARANNVLRVLNQVHEQAWSLDHVWPSHVTDFVKLLLLQTRTARYTMKRSDDGLKRRQKSIPKTTSEYSYNTDDDTEGCTYKMCSCDDTGDEADTADAENATKEKVTVTWTRSSVLATPLSDDKYAARAIQVLRQSRAAFLTDLRARRQQQTAEVLWQRALKTASGPIDEFVEQLQLIKTSDRREFKLLLKALRMSADELPLDDYEAKAQIVITGRWYRPEVDPVEHKIVFNYGNLHPHPLRALPMRPEFQTRLRSLQRKRHWPVYHTYRPSNIANHHGHSNSNRSKWAEKRSTKAETFWTTTAH
ncbi:TPA: hypothetical protein N0F65_005914 [Lagenidium giganteum]|uniref:VWFA domain-containing protein n=1 Tax=Lagenidium giganteum TaxID=4803 RepID=A0AAV2Z838_9STRA|nr:TPA: hypothetical protein N0F65_005914 [Lagenidium giganteum]